MYPGGKRFPLPPSDRFPVTTTNHLRALASPCYLMALLLVLFPLTDALSTVWPLRPGEFQWRFGAVGLFSQALMTPLLGLVLALVTAFVLEHRAVLRTLSVLAALGGVLLLVVLAGFALDAAQMRGQVRPELKSNFDVASIAAAMKLLLAAILALVVTWVGWKRSRRSRRARAHPQPGTPLVAGTARAEPR